VRCLLIGKAEVIAVFHRKLRESIVDVSGYHLLCDQFDADCASGLWQWHPVDDALLRLTAQRFRELPPTPFSERPMHSTSLAQQKKASPPSTPATGT